MARRPKVEIPIDPEVLAELNAVTEERLKLEVEFNAKNEAFEAKRAAEAAAHAAEMLPLKVAMDALDARHWEVITANQASLIPEGRQSFVTGVATFKFDNYAAKREVTDSKGLMDTAREQRVVRFVAKPIREWKLVPTKFFAWFDKTTDKVLRQKFVPFVKDVPAWRKLSVTPNATYAVVLDNTRLTPPPITSRRDVDKDGNIIEPEPTPMS